MHTQRLIERGDGSVLTLVWDDRIDHGAVGGIAPFHLLGTLGG